MMVKLATQVAIVYMSNYILESLSLWFRQILDSKITFLLLITVFFPKRIHRKLKVTFSNLKIFSARTFINCFHYKRRIFRQRFLCSRRERNDTLYGHLATLYGQISPGTFDLKCHVE